MWNSVVWQQRKRPDCPFSSIFQDLSKGIFTYTMWISYSNFSHLLGLELFLNTTCGVLNSPSHYVAPSRAPCHPPSLPPIFDLGMAYFLQILQTFIVWVFLIENIKKKFPQRSFLHILLSFHSFIFQTRQRECDQKLFIMVSPISNLSSTWN